MLPPSLIDYALKKGADGVMVSGCRSGDCFYRFGNRWMERRIQGDRKPVLRPRVERQRITVAGGAETDGRKLRREIKAFRRELLAFKHDKTDADAEKESSHG